MNQTLLLVGHELKLMWKELRYSLKRTLSVLLIIQVFAMVIALHIAFATILFLLFDVSPEAGAGLVEYLGSLGFTASRMSEIAYYILLFFLLSSFLRGLLSSSFGWLFTRVDESVIITSPTAPHALYLAKRFRRFLVHIVMVALLFFGVYPLVIRAGFQGFQLLLLYVTILALVEIYGLIENITYSVSRGLMKRRSAAQTAALSVGFVALALFVFASPLIIRVDGTSVEFLNNIYPPYLSGQLLTHSSSIDNALGASLLAGEAILFLVVASSTARFGLRRWAASPRFVQTRSRIIGLRKNMLSWKSKKKSSVRLIFAKDLWTAIRIPAKFLVPLLITFMLLLFAVQLQIVSPESLPSPSIAQSTDPVFLLSAYLLSVFILPPAWDSFASERRTIFLLKAAPIAPSSIIMGKYFFALLKSAAYIVPIIVSMSILLPHTSAIPLVALQVTLVLLISNAVGVLSSVSYPPTYRGVGPPPFLVVLGLPLLCTVLTAIIPIVLILSYGSTFQFILQFVIVLFYVILVIGFCLRKAAESLVRLQEF